MENLRDYMRGSPQSKQQVIDLINPATRRATLTETNVLKRYGLTSASFRLKSENAGSTRIFNAFLLGTASVSSSMGLSALRWSLALSIRTSVASYSAVSSMPRKYLRVL